MQMFNVKNEYSYTFTCNPYFIMKINEYVLFHAIFARLNAQVCTFRITYGSVSLSSDIMLNDTRKLVVYYGIICNSNGM